MLGKRMTKRSSRLEFLESRRVLAATPLASGQPVIISEFVADSHASLETATRSTVASEFSAAGTPDWIELFNASPGSIDIGGMHLTDDAGQPTKWRFPAQTRIAAGEHLVVFASGENIVDQALDQNGFLHTNFRLQKDGGYLALTNSDGSTAHEIADYPALPSDVSWAVPMDDAELLGAGAELSYLIPRDAQHADQWQQPEFDSPDLIEAPDQLMPIGYDRAEASSELAETVGEELFRRASGDFSRGSIIVLEDLEFTKPGRLNQWSFYSETSRVITPLLFQRSGEEFEIVATGLPRTSDGSGEQTFEFDLQSGDATVVPGTHYFGFKDGDNTTDEMGVIRYDRLEQSVRRYGGPLSGSVDSGVVLSGGSSQGRTYSVQATTTSVLQGPFATDVIDSIDNATGIYTRQLFDGEQLDQLRSLSLDVRYNDGFVAYINGIEVARRNADGQTTFESVASQTRSLNESNRFETINVSFALSLLQDGSNLLAVHTLNDVAGGGTLVLDTRLRGTLIADDAPVQFADIPSPNTNNLRTSEGLAVAPTFSHERGFHTEPFELQLSAVEAGATIYVTTDGTDPQPENPTATVYEQPLPINTTAIVRAAVYSEGLIPSPIATSTFIFPIDVATDPVLAEEVVNDPTWGAELVASLESQPAISLVTTEPITINAGEISTSVEWLTDGESLPIQVDAGVEIFGGTAIGFPKRSMRLSFKKQYGPSELNYDLFETPGGVTEFDQLILRPGSHDTPFWSNQLGVGSYIRNRWANDRQLDMGQPAPRGRFIHVYLNGTYWGQYQLMERPNAAFMASNFGGSAEDYDVLNAGEAIDGDTVAWEKLIDALDESYEAVQQYLDVESYADYLLLQFFGGNNIDWRTDANWIAARRREPGAGFQFFAWDSDIILRTGRDTDIVNFGGPGLLWTRDGGLRQYPEFLSLLAQRAQLHFFDGGMFTPERFRAEFDTLIERARPGIIAETARWGDGNYTPATWEAAVAWMKDTYAATDGPSRAEIVLEQMRSAGVFPLADAPDFLVDGQATTAPLANAGESLQMAAAQGDIYYTTDGSDPRLAASPAPAVPLIDPNSSARWHVPSAETAADWHSVSFDDASWNEGQNGIGFDTSSGQEWQPYVRTNTEEAAKGINASTYVRIAFDVEDPAAFESLRLLMRYDDGFVAYLNGTEVAKRNAPNTPQWNSTASRTRTQIEAVGYEPFNLTRSELQTGTNVLAIHALNDSVENVDMLMDAQLLAGEISSPLITAQAQQYVEPIALASNANYAARTYWAGEWSPLRRISTVSPPAGLQISEVMFHPSDPTAAEIAAGFTDADDFEFIEFTNTSDVPVSLDGVNLVKTTPGGEEQGVSFNLRGARDVILPGQFIVIAEDSDAFRFRYGANLPLLGEWSGGLSNNAEQITVTWNEQVQIQFTYDDDWYAETDGLGSSLVYVSDAAQTASIASDWQASSKAGGTPGAANSTEAVFGDINNDGLFDSADLALAFAAGEYEDDTEDNSTLAEGDWNGDGDFTTADLVLAFQLGVFSQR